MAIVEREFFRKGLPHGNYLSHALLFNTETGELRVRKYRTSHRGNEIDWEEGPIANYLGGKSRGRRPLKAMLEKIGSALHSTPPLVHAD
ncbi:MULTISPECIES: hypothetical protein [unclassified Sinorhizobium]|uniref:hypothetical protein n=1 Tax=unclassified Sinorhizobium TaxID=2613772 RepID=UPI0024C30E25|nr:MULTISPECIES: hypothetical protein [unclassified Sinorhizobium]MDK1377106.1 hypothetical protein [Sinorhizobium sp. 6-70]MDK1479599.1 hypothetical protein [Sinorhizobium sp. 6-117]